MVNVGSYLAGGWLGMLVKNGSKPVNGIQWLMVIINGCSLVAES